MESRRGRITASRLGDVLAGESTKRYLGYAQQLADEREGGFLDPGVISNLRFLAAGKSIESQAVGAYELHNGIEVEYFGADNPTFNRANDPALGCFGYSPDAHVGNGGLEVKCVFSKSKQDRRLLKGFEPGLKPQVFGQLLASEFDWWDLESYCPLYRNDPRELYVERIWATDTFVVRRQEYDLASLREKIIEYDQYVESLR